MVWHGVAWHGMTRHGLAWRAEMACHGMRRHGMAWRGVACWLRVAWWAMSVRPLARPRRRRRKRRSKNPRRVSTSETRKRGDEERRNAGTQERRNEGTKVSSRNRTRVGCSSSQARRPLYYGRVERWSIPEKANILWCLDGSLRTLECSLHGLGSVLLSTAAAVGAPTEVGAACVAAATQ